MRVEHYKVVTADNKDIFEIMITRDIGNGWKPYGGVSITYNPITEKVEFAQAMIME